MAIPRNIDLTERGDFFNDVLVPQIDVDSSGGELIYVTQMTREEYEKLMAYENIFGRKGHYTDYLDVFREDEFEWIERNKCHCGRCGKEIRIPWKRYCGVCYECNSIIDSLVLPWQSPLADSDDGYDLFNLR